MNSKVHNFFIQIPFLAKADKPKKVSYMLDLLYKDELKNESSPYSRTEKFMKKGDRFEDFDIFRFKDKEMLEHCLRLCKIVEYKHYAELDSINISSYNSIVENAKSFPEQPEADKFLTIEEAKTALWE